MNGKILSILFIFSLAIFAACDKKTTANKTSSAQPEIKKGVQPVADNEVAVIEMEEPAFGTIKIELYSNIAPKMVARFKELAREGFYNGQTFHRISESVIQSGDPLSKDDDPTNDGTGNSDKPNVEAELSDIPYEAGTVGAARKADFNSANSQFFINFKRQPAFDNKYTVFGKVIEGMNNVQTIAGAPAANEKPLEPIKIKQITIQPR